MASLTLWLCQLSTTLDFSLVLTLFISLMNIQKETARFLKFDMKKIYLLL